MLFSIVVSARRALLLVQTATLAAVVASELQYEVCIACHSPQLFTLFGYRLLSIDPCWTIRDELTQYVNSEIDEVFQQMGLASSTPDLTPESATSSSRTTFPGFSFNRERELKGKSKPTCRDLCSTYPDCSAWCPNGVRRRGRELQNDDYPGHEGNGTEWNLDSRRLYTNPYGYPAPSPAPVPRTSSSESGTLLPTLSPTFPADDPVARELEKRISEAGKNAYWVAMVSPTVKSFSCLQSLMGSSCQARAVRVA